MSSESAVDSNLNALRFEVFAQQLRVRKVAVVREGDRVAGFAVMDDDRLGVAGQRAASSAVAGVADGDVSTQVGEVFFIEDLRDEAHACPEVEIDAVAGRDASTFLAAMLKGVQPIEGEASYVVSGAIDAKYATGFVRAIVFRDHYWLVALPQGDVNGLFSIGGASGLGQRPAR